MKYVFSTVKNLADASCLAFECDLTVAFGA